MTSSTDVIAVLGATGRTGGATVRHLRGRGVPVRALTRDPAAPAARALAGGGVNVVPANLDDVASLRTALRGVSRLLNVQPAYDSRGRYQGEQERAQGANVAEAVGQEGVRHVVQVSAGPGEPTGLPHFDAKLEIRAALEDTGAVVDALHPTPFMELMTDSSFAPALSTWGVEPRIVGWDRPLPWVAVDDIGRVAARALTGPIPDAGSARLLVGDLRSLRDCRRVLTERTGRRPRRVPVPTPIFRAMVGPELVEMWEWLRDYPDPPLTAPDDLLNVPGWADTLAADSAAA